MYIFNIWSLGNCSHQSAIIWYSFCFLTLCVLQRFCYNQTSSARNCNLCLQSPEERGIFIQILESAYRFTLGSIGGGKLIACTVHALFTLPVLNPSMPELNVWCSVGGQFKLENFMPTKTDGCLLKVFLQITDIKFRSVFIN